MAPFKGAGGETWRARQGADGDVRRPESGSSPGRPREGDGPDRWGPPVGGRKGEGEKRWSGLGREEGRVGPVWAAREGKRRKKRKMGRVAGLG